MKQNLIVSAFDQVSIEPSPTFRGELRAQFIHELSYPGVSDTPTPVADRAPESSTSEPADAYVKLAASPQAANRNRRLIRIGLAAAASIVLVATAAIVVTQSHDSSGELNDVDAEEALPLARQAFINSDALGRTYHETVLIPESVENKMAAETRAAMPECAFLPSVGLMQPSSKAVAPSQFFEALGGIAHTVHVFATPQDASRAMDVIAGDVYPACRFDLFDREIPFEGVNQSAASESWDAPEIPAHGDRQIVFGQHTIFTGGVGASEVFYVNVFVQVGRAISWMNPQLLSTDDPLFVVNKASDAQTAALESVFGH